MLSSIKNGIQKEKTSVSWLCGWHDVRWSEMVLFKSNYKT